MRIDGLGVLVGVMALGHARSFAEVISDKAAKHTTDSEKCASCESLESCKKETEVMGEAAANVVKSIEALLKAINEYEGADHESDGSEEAGTKREE